MLYANCIAASLYTELYYNICMSEIITVRVEKTLKEKIRQHGINVSETVRMALEDEVKRLENAELSRAISEMKLVLYKIPDAEIVNAVRVSRDQR